MPGEVLDTYAITLQTPSSAGPVQVLLPTCAGRRWASKCTRKGFPCRLLVLSVGPCLGVQTGSWGRGRGSRKGREGMSTPGRTGPADSRPRSLWVVILTCFSKEMLFLQLILYEQ